jgi:serine/threonine-protein kinase
VKGVPSSKPEGTVLGQSPQAGSSQPHGSHVYFTVASGATTSGSATGTTSTGSSTSSTTSTVVASVQVPNVVGLQRDAAQGAIHGAGLVSEVKGVPSIEPEGTILGQSPGAGTSAQRGSHVYMTVASGARPKSD